MLAKAVYRRTSQGGSRRGFTLIELLVVIAVIAILASLLLPALARAKGKAHQIKCVSNNKQVMLAFLMYAEDNREHYPLSRGWQDSGGKDGKYDVFVAMTNRPLYRYQGNPEIFRCPADKGDLFREQNVHDYAATNCWDQYGNSYLMEWAIDFARVRRVTGDIEAQRNTDQAKSITTAEIALGASKKIVQGDWIWHFNRGVTDKKSVWHNYKGKSLAIIAFGDGHAQAYRFPLKAVNDSFWSAKPDVQFLWW